MHRQVWGGLRESRGVTGRACEPRAPRPGSLPGFSALFPPCGCGWIVYLLFLDWETHGDGPALPAAASANQLGDERVGPCLSCGAGLWPLPLALGPHGSQGPGHHKYGQEANCAAGLRWRVGADSVTCRLHPASQPDPPSSMVGTGPRTPQQGASSHFPTETLLDSEAQSRSRTNLSSVFCPRSSLEGTRPQMVPAGQSLGDP